MDSGNSGSISSSGDEEYDSSRAPDHTIFPPTFLNHPPTPPYTHFGNSISSQQHDLHHSTNLFDLSSTYHHLHSFPQSQNSLLNLESGSGTSHQGNLQSSSSIMNNQSNLLGLPPQENNNNSAIRLLSSSSSSPTTTTTTTNTTNVSRNSKKRTRASRRAPTTVLTTDTTNFRSMVQEFTGIPAAPPFSAAGSSSYSSRGRFDHFLAAGSSNSLRSQYLDASGTGFYPFRPLPQKVVQQNHPLLFSSSSSRLLHNNIMGDAFASNNTNVSSSSSNNNYQLPHHDMGLQQYHQHPVQNMMLSMQNHPILGFNPSPPPPLPTAGFGAKSQTGLSMTSFEDMIAAAGGVSVQPGHEHVASEGMQDQVDEVCRRDPLGP